MKQIENFRTKKIDVTTLTKTMEDTDVDFDAEIKRHERIITTKTKNIENVTRQLAAYDISNADEAIIIGQLNKQMIQFVKERKESEDKLKVLYQEKAELEKHQSDSEGFANSLSSFVDSYPNMTYDERLKAIRNLVDFVIYFEETDTVDIVFKGSGKTKEEYFKERKPTSIYSKRNTYVFPCKEKRFKCCIR